MPRVKKVVVTADDSLNKKVTAETPSGLPDIIVKPLTIIQRILIRAAKVYTSSLIAFMGASLVGISVVPQGDLNQFITTLYTAMQLACIPTIGATILNISIFLSKLDESAPEVLG